VLLLGTDVFATVIYALRFQSGGIANATAWAAVFCLGVCLAIAIWWIVPLGDNPPTEDFQNIPVSLEQTFRAVQISSAVFFLLGFVCLCASVASYS
jgi:formate hydrogenlyase subunit 3/multisubunit Na+/H+ antiporter MnhD subunit